MQPEARAVWDKLWSRASFLDGATSVVTSQFQSRLVIGKFAASIETVQNTSDPVEMTASVGWASSAAYQQYDFDHTFRTPVSTHFVSHRDGGWVEVQTAQVWSDDDVVEALLDTLGVWVQSDGRFSD